MMKSVVKTIGSLALDFEEDKILILFGPKAPSELQDISIIHEFIEIDPLSFEDQPTYLIVDNRKYEIIQIGSQAMKNLQELGHISLYFTDPPEEILPGAVYLFPQVLPKIQVGTCIEFL